MPDRDIEPQFISDHERAVLDRLASIDATKVVGAEALDEIAVLLGVAEASRADLDGAGSPWPRRPMTLCADRWPDGDDGPPWGPRPAVMDGEVQADG
jgi:hypothetical protein